MDFTGLDDKSLTNALGINRIQTNEPNQAPDNNGRSQKEKPSPRKSANQLGDSKSKYGAQLKMNAVA